MTKNLFTCTYKFLYSSPVYTIDTLLATCSDICSENTVKYSAV